jgi:hypothetical protein
VWAWQRGAGASGSQAMSSWPATGLYVNVSTCTRPAPHTATRIGSEDAHATPPGWVAHLSSGEGGLPSPAQVGP